MRGLLNRMTGRWRISAGTASAATIGLGLLLFACVLVATAGPRANTQLQTNAVRQLIAGTPVDKKIIDASVPYTQAEPAQQPLSAKDMATVGVQLHDLLRNLPLSPASTDTAVFTSAFIPVE